MSHIILFEKFKVRKVKRIYKHLDDGKGGTSTIVSSLDKKDSYISTGNADIALDILNDLMSKLSKRFGLDSKVKYFNAGAFGMAFIVDDKIIKLTSSRSEAGVVKGLIGRKIPNTVNYYDIVYVKKYEIYAILMDRADKIPKRVKPLIDQLCNYETLEEFRGFSLANFKDLAINTLSTNLSNIELSNIYNDYKEMITSLDKNEISTDDLHSGNIGYLHGKLVHFDMMDYTLSNDLEKISKVKIGKKHLIRFSESKENKYLTVKNIVEDIKDICIELQDREFNVRVEPDNDIKIKVISLKSDEVFANRNFNFYVDITKAGSIFNISEVSDVIERLVEYMESNGYKCKLKIPPPQYGSSVYREIDIVTGTFPNIGNPKNILLVKVDFTKV